MGAALDRLRAERTVDPSLLEFGEQISRRSDDLRARAVENAASASEGVRAEAEAQRAQMRGSIDATRTAVAASMSESRGSIAGARKQNEAALAVRGTDARARSAETRKANLKKLDDTAQTGHDDLNKVFDDADTDLKNAGQKRGQEVRDHAEQLAQRAIQMGQSEAARQRREEEDPAVAGNKARAVAGVANRFADRLRLDGRSLAAELETQLDETRERVEAERKPATQGLAKVGDAAEGRVNAAMDSVDEGVGNIIDQGTQQLAAGEKGSLGEVDNLSRAAEGRTKEMEGRGDLGIDAALAAGLAAQDRTALEAGRAIDEGGAQAIDQLAQLAGAEAAPTLNAPPPAASVPLAQPGEAPPAASVPLAQAGEAPPAAPVPLEQGGERSAGGAVIDGQTQAEALSQLSAAEPLLDQAAADQTARATPAFTGIATGAGDAAQAFQASTKQRMGQLRSTTAAGFSDIGVRAGKQLTSSLDDANKRADKDVQGVSKDLSGNVTKIRDSLRRSVKDASARLEQPTRDGKAKLSQNLQALPAAMTRAAREQEGFIGWLKQQVDDTVQAFKALGTSGFWIDFAVGLAAAIVVAPFGTESNDWLGTAKAQGARQQAVEMVRSARQNPVNGRTPRVVWSFSKGVGSDVREALLRIGVNEVRGRVVKAPPPLVPPIPPGQETNEEE